MVNTQHTFRRFTDTVLRRGAKILPALGAVWLRAGPGWFHFIMVIKACPNRIIQEILFRTYLRKHTKIAKFAWKWQNHWSTIITIFIIVFWKSFCWVVLSQVKINATSWNKWHKLKYLYEDCNTEYSWWVFTASMQLVIICQNILVPTYCGITI